MSTQITTSVIIVGAGPAGSTTSIFLSKMNIPHILLDKEAFPRDKICGDACSGKTTEVLRKANPEWLKEIIRDDHRYFPCDGIEFVAPNGKSLPVPFRLTKRKDNEITGFTSPRMIFDQFLFEKANSSASAKVWTGIRIIEINKTDAGVQVIIEKDKERIDISAPLIIGADGDKSMVAKSVGHHTGSHKSDCVGLRAYYDQVEGMSQEHFIELHFMKDFLPGYFWIFPLPGGKANVGVGMLSDYVRKHKINLRERMLQVIGNHPVLKHRFAQARLEGKIQGWGLPMANKRRQLSGDRYMLTGDAASLIDPFSGEGIGNAMYSGMLAAQASEKALQAGDYSSSFFLQEYDQAVYRYFGDEFRISATMQKLCNYPFLFNLIVNKSQKSASLRKTISGMFSDMQVRNQLSKPSFFLKVLFNQ